MLSRQSSENRSRMDAMKIFPARSLHGDVSVPGDKSISHRAAILASLCSGEMRITNFAESDDCFSTLSCLGQLGTQIEREGPDVFVTGTGVFNKPAAELYCGNSGTTMRLLAGILAGQPFDTVLTGDASLQERPMSRIIEPLTAMGARIDSDQGRAPLAIEGGHPLEGIEFVPPKPSAQVKSCVLMAGLRASGETSVAEAVKTRDHTERMLRWLNVDIETDDGKVTIRGGQSPAARDISVPGDISSASFLVAAAACLEGSDVTISGVGLNPTRTAVLDVFGEMGANIEVNADGEKCNEPVGSLRVRGGFDRPHRPLVISGSRIAKIIDEIPILAVCGTRISGGIEFRNADELRVKESDRIASVVTNLRRMGADVEEFPDGFRVGPSALSGAVVDSFGDHRIAMAFAVASLFAASETELAGAECVSVSFPQFFGVLADLTRT